MKLTLITPTHNTQYLKELYASLATQTDKNWEWLIVLNGGAVAPGISDSRITYHTMPPSIPKLIGAVKNYAFSLVKDTILVELDHDDILMPTAVEKIKKAFEDPSVGFVYSDAAEFWDKTWETNTYSKAYGWDYYDIAYNGKILPVAHSFEPTPHSLAKIYFAPNHVRAWRSSIYEAIGGHDVTLRVLDDQDLLCRTYMATKMKLIPECLYLYRNSPGQSFRVYNAEIQENTYTMSNKYLMPMAEKWCLSEGYPKIDLGAAHGKPSGYVGVDLHGSDITTNLNKQWPFETSSVGMIRAFDFLEHMEDPIHFMNEAYRVLRPGGFLFTFTPSTDGRGAFQDPTHISFWNTNSMWYYTDKNYSKYVPEIKCRFQMVYVSNHFPSEFHKLHNIMYMTANMVAVKDNMPFRLPDMVKI